MADTIANIQTDARFFAQDEDLNITSGTGLRVFSLAYQGMLTPGYKLGGVLKIGRRWPEVTREDTSITTTAGTEQYTWVTSPVFKEEPYLEFVDASDSIPSPIVPAPNMKVWSDEDSTTNGTPRYYRLIDVAGTVKLALRPKPDTTGDTIRITGIIEASEFSNPATTTVDIDSASGQAVLSIADTTMFKAEDRFIVAEGTTLEETGIVLSVSAGVSITATANLAGTHTAAVAATVAKLTVFRHKNSDRALAAFVAYQYLRKRNKFNEAQSVALEGLQLLPTYDYSPTLRPGSRSTPYWT